MRLADCHNIADFRDLARRKLAQYERVFAWYLSQNELEQARLFVKSLHAEFGGESRWAIFAGRLDDVARRVQGEVPWRDWGAEA